MKNKYIILLSIVLGLYICSIVFFSVYIGGMTLFCFEILPLLVILEIISIYNILNDILSPQKLNDKYYKNNNDLLIKELKNGNCIRQNKRK
jgi:cellulose synthase/poly-beta-1,6-N-acetylglucosamine synthase-like glycosyltransferase